MTSVDNKADAKAHTRGSAITFPVPSISYRYTCKNENGGAQELYSLTMVFQYLWSIRYSPLHIPEYFFQLWYVLYPWHSWQWLPVKEIKYNMLRNSYGIASDENTFFSQKVLIYS